MYWSKEPRIHAFVEQKIEEGWEVQKRKKHHALIAPNKRRIAIPSSPSDCKAYLSFRRQVKYLYYQTNADSG